MDRDTFLNSPVRDIPHIEVPRWIDKDITGYQVIEVTRHGCASGAYMPAVTYHTALHTLSEEFPWMENYLEQCGWDELAIDVMKHGWAHTAVQVLSIAVECWCANHVHLVEEAADTYAEAS